MPEVDVKNGHNEKIGTMILEDPIFGLKVSTGLLHEATQMQLASMRQGTAATKTRGLVSGGGKKPWKQKGTGRARAGSNRSPIWRGGGTTFGPQGVSAEPIVSARALDIEGSCVANPTRLCLQGGRFAVEARWRDFQGNTGDGQAVPLAGGDTGWFWFFGPSNVEGVLKVLDGRDLNNRFWVFYGALSSVEYTLTVTDTVTGNLKTYTNPSGRLASVADTSAF